MEYKYPFGKEKGKPLSECSTNSLNYYIEKANVDDPQYGDKNKKMVAECQKILAARGAGSGSSGSKGSSVSSEIGKDIKRILSILSQAFPEFSGEPGEEDTPF